MIKTAILVDGGFYRKRAKHLWGIKTAEERAQELTKYFHKKDGMVEQQLYRIFYYDCEPKGVCYTTIIAKLIEKHAHL